MVDWRVKMYCDEIVISDAILRRVDLEMTLLTSYHTPNRTFRIEERKKIAVENGSKSLV